MKKIISFFIAFALLITLLPVHQAAAATVNAHYKVNVDTKLNVRDKPSPKAKVIGSLKNGTVVFVYSSESSGWSKIKYNGKAGYVASSFLKLTNSYLMDPSKTYTYIYYYSSGNEYETNNYVGMYQGWQQWNSSSHNHLLGVKEDATGLYELEWGYRVRKMIPYPLKAGKTFEEYEYINEAPADWSKVLSINGTLKTRAGTFKNVVTTHRKGNTYYYAPNVGLIGGSYNGKLSFELYNLKKKK